MILNIFRLVFLGIFTGIVFGYLAEQRVNYIKYFLRISILHSLAIFIVAFIFHGTFSRHLQILNWELIVLFILPIPAIDIIFLAFRRFIRKDIVFYHQNHGIYASSLSCRYAISKSFNVLFQQTLILASIFTLLDMGISTFQIIVLFAAGFGIAHIIIVDHKKPYTLLVIIASFFGGGIFSYLILFFPYGFFYSYLLHWLFLVVLGISPHFLYKKRTNLLSQYQ